MGKRSNFERNPRDFYPTPYEAVGPLLPHISGQFCEPCAGDGALVSHLEMHGLFCTVASDIEPRHYSVRKMDAMDIAVRHQQFITNPPWDRKILHPIIDHLSVIAPTWLLIDADWMHTKQAVPYLKRCRKIVSVGRVKWIPGTKTTGKENCCWYLFDVCGGNDIRFYGRSE